MSFRGIVTTYCHKECEFDLFLGHSADHLRFKNFHIACAGSAFAHGPVGHTQTSGLDEFASGRRFGTCLCAAAYCAYNTSGLWLRNFQSLSSPPCSSQLSGAASSLGSHLYHLLFSYFDYSSSAVYSKKYLIPYIDRQLQPL